MKFIYLSDSHLGGKDNHGYRQQSRYLSQAKELITRLGEWISQAGDIDFVLHGGDMVENGTRENILMAAELFSVIQVPIYLTLGNHDLTEPDSYAEWMRQAPQFFRNGTGNFSVTHGPVDLDILCIHWSPTPYHWMANQPQIPYLDAEQFKMMEYPSERIRVIATHAPPCGLPCSQTGMETELHSPEGNFQSVVQDLSNRYKPVLFLGAHTHMNLNVHYGITHLVTVSSFTEAPFDFKVFEISDNGTVHMDTVNLASSVSFRVNYDFNKTYVQGRPCDRTFS